MSTLKGYLCSLSFDGRTVTITSKLRGQVRVPLSAVQAISMEKAGVGMRGVRFSVAGATNPHQTQAFQAHRDVASDPYAVTFRKKRLPEFEAMVKEIEKARGECMTT